jgi:hypothetical protein
MIRQYQCLLQSPRVCAAEDKTETQTVQETWTAAAQLLQAAGAAAAAAARTEQLRSCYDTKLHIFKADT